MMSCLDYLLNSEDVKFLKVGGGVDKKLVDRLPLPSKLPAALVCHWPIGRATLVLCNRVHDLIPAPTNKVVMPMSEGNHARVLSQGRHVEFWLNGVKTVEFERGSPAFRAAVAASKFKDIPDFGEWPDGHILVQEPGSVVSFCNVKIRELPAK